jgi:hypothetical protein
MLCKEMDQLLVEKEILLALGGHSYIIHFSAVNVDMHRNHGQQTTGTIP